MSHMAAVQVEAHLLHNVGSDFYGCTLKLLVTGFLRPEMKFDSIAELVDRIHKDIGSAQAQLADADLEQPELMDSFLVR
jgi:riboflavin kinase